MSKFEKKYGIKEDDTVKNYHKNRRMFVILDEELNIADAGLTCSHAVWFVQQGFMPQSDDSLMDEVVRGIVDPKGNVYFYVGYDFAVNKKCEDEFFLYLEELVNRLQLKPTAQVFGGLIQQTTPGQWPPRKTYGTIRELLHKDSV